MKKSVIGAGVLCCMIMIAFSQEGLGEGMLFGTKSVPSPINIQCCRSLA